jgi:hypothetical protein
MREQKAFAYDIVRGIKTRRVDVPRGSVGVSEVAKFLSACAHAGHVFPDHEGTILSEIPDEELLDNHLG